MRKRKKLSQRETQWVDGCITDSCEQNGVNPGDGSYRSTGWAAFLEHYQSCDRLWEADFWPRAITCIHQAIGQEKLVRTSLLYRVLSLDRALLPEGNETFLDRLPTNCGDFTNGVAFFDFLAQLPEELRRLARSLLDGYTLEESRSLLSWSGRELLDAVDGLRQALLEYEAL